MNNQAGDFSIITLNAEATMTHKIGNATHGFTTVTNGTYLAPPVGSTIRKYGHISGYATGTVRAVNISTRDQNDGITIKGFTRVELNTGTNAAGDSGGPYLVSNSFCGVHSGSGMSNDINYLYFTPYSLIANAGFAAIGSHDCASWTDNGRSTHYGYCTICQTTVYEQHYEYWGGNPERCLRCGRTDPIIIPPTT